VRLLQRRGGELGLTLNDDGSRAVLKVNGCCAVAAQVAVMDRLGAAAEPERVVDPQPVCGHDVRSLSSVVNVGRTGTWATHARHTRTADRLLRHPSRRHRRPGHVRLVQVKRPTVARCLPHGRGHRCPSHSYAPPMSAAPDSSTLHPAPRELGDRARRHPAGVDADGLRLQTNKAAVLKPSPSRT
jgi:hypothetical protein